MMELNDLKNLWNQAPVPDHSKNEPASMVNQFTKNQFRSRINRIAFYEWLGSFLCMGFIPIIGYQMQNLKTAGYQFAAVATMLLLLSISAISIRSIMQLRSGINLCNTYAQSLNEFARRRIQFGQLQRYNVFLCYPLLVCCVLLMAELFAKKDLLHNAYFWTFSLSGGYILLLFLSRWVNRYYSKTLDQANSILQDVQG